MRGTGGSAFSPPGLRFKSYDEMNAWLLDQCIAYAKAHRHPELDQPIWDVFEAERPKLVPYAGRFDGFHAVTASVSKTCLVRQFWTPIDSQLLKCAHSQVTCHKNVRLNDRPVKRS